MHQKAYISETKIRVRYSETDQAGLVYYGNYAQYYEVGRIEALRQLGHTYKGLEEAGVVMPVLSMNIKYIRPALYDDLLTIKTIIREAPITRMNFEYEISNESGKLLNKGETTLVFVSKETYKTIKAPEWFTGLIEKAINEDD
ncbi:MAG: acyl-CoA thioesterase [Chlorobi bacterium]|nr:acyl-CoA thioesterase [Chlorobiota bacterium]